MTFDRQAEFEALRATIRERGTVRMCAVLGGLALWGALLVAVLAARLDSFVTLGPAARSRHSVRSELLRAYRGRTHRSLSTGVVRGSGDSARVGNHRHELWRQVSRRVRSALREAVRCGHYRQSPRDARHRRALAGVAGARLPRARRFRLPHRRSTQGSGWPTRAGPRALPRAVFQVVDFESQKSAVLRRLSASPHRISNRRWVHH